MSTNVNELPDAEPPPDVGTKAGVAQQMRHLLAVHSSRKMMFWLKHAVPQKAYGAVEARGAKKGRTQSSGQKKSACAETGRSGSAEAAEDIIS